MSETSRATKRLLWIIGGLLLVLVILGVVGRTSGFLGGPGQATEVEIADASIRTITQVVTASGKIQPETEITISPDVSGEIIELRVKEGDVVDRGALLVRIKPDFYLTQVDQAEAGVLQAKATMAQRRADLLRAESDLGRQEELFRSNAISRADLELAQTQFEVARAALEGAEYAVRSADARMNEAQEQLSRTVIYSPMSGTISMLNVELGERVVGTSQMAGTDMMRIARLDQMEVEIDVNENEIVHVALGDTAAINVDAYPERRFRGLVTEIANSARTTAPGSQEQVTNFPVKVRILDAHNIGAAGGLVDSRTDVPQARDVVPNFRPGMSAAVDVFTETVHDVVAVPIQAVTVRDFNTVRPSGENADSAVRDVSSSSTSSMEDLRRVVFLVVDGKAEMAEVETGISDDTHIEIRAGLTGREQVVIGPYRIVSRTLVPGDVVRAQQERRGFVATGGS